MGETRVDLLHLLEDLRDAYPGSTEETILTEIIANALDSGARRIAIDTDASAPAVTIADDGAGMRRRELARYHDIAASTKVRGAGIGFAGVGIKIALLVCAEVLTETRRRDHHVASAWRLASRQKAPWHWVPPPGLVADQGTAVRLILANALSPLVDPGFIEASLRRNFQPLFEPALGDILRDHYPRGLVFVLNSRALETHDASEYVIAPVVIRLGRKRRPAGAGYLVRDAAPLPEDQRGVAVSTFGKVIKRGWDWLGLTPGAPSTSAASSRSRPWPNASRSTRATSSGPARAAPRISPIARRSRRPSRISSRNGGTRASPPSVHAAAVLARWSAIWDACSRISRTTSRCSRAWSSTAPADSADSRSPALAHRAMRPLALDSPRKNPLSQARRRRLPRRAMRRRLRQRTPRPRWHRPHLPWVGSKVAYDTGARRAMD